MSRDTSGPKNEPQYSGLGAPADAADMTELGAYAAKVGNRKADTNAARTSATGADVWEGLEWRETDTGNTYEYTSSSWVVTRSPAAIPVTTFGTNWTAGTSAQVPLCYRQGNLIAMFGTVIIGSSGGGGGYSSILTVPASVQPPNANTRFIGTAVTSTGLVFALGLSSGVVGSVSGYITGSLGFSTRITLNCSWYLD